jgi:hypothetical protein
MEGRGMGLMDADVDGEWIGEGFVLRKRPYQKYVYCKCTYDTCIFLLGGDL